MKQRWIEYTPTWRPGPLSYWVHVEQDGQAWCDAERFEPPLPNPVPGSGYARFFVEFKGHRFEFASLDELRACIEILGRKLLPTTLRLTKDRGGDLGPNQHWLSRMPPKTKPWRFREPAVAYLIASLADFQRQLK